MMRCTRGCFVEVHVELHMSSHTFSFMQIACNAGEVQATEARDWPSNLVKIWVLMMSGLMSVIDVGFPACPQDLMAIW